MTVDFFKMPVADIGQDGELDFPWISFGKIRQSQRLFNSKSVQVEGANNDGTLWVDDLRLTTDRRIKFATNFVTPESLELEYGLKDQIEDDVPNVPFFSNGERQGWLHSQMTEMTADGERVLCYCCPGRLRLAQNPQYQSDAILYEYELIIAKSPLSFFKSFNVRDRKYDMAETWNPIA